jgi:hypothetical protein
VPAASGYLCAAADGTTYSATLSQKRRAPWCRRTPRPCRRPQMVFHDVYDRVIGVTLRPIALPLEHHGHRSDRLRARLESRRSILTFSVRTI